MATTDAVLGLGATRHGLVPDGSILRLARIVGLGRAKELTLLNDHVTPAAALAMGLVNWVVEPDAVEGALAEVVEKAFHASRTATGHAKRLLHASFHRDPREMVEDLMRAQNECMGSWEMERANRAWDERREVRFYPPPPSRNP
jgi:enoyl-CoA hydratase/carnithine racemase